MAATAVSQNTSASPAGEVKATGTPQPVKETSAPAVYPTVGVTPFTSIEGFPVDVPMLLENNGDLRTQLTQGTAVYSFTTNLSVGEVITFYQEGMQDYAWELISQTKGTNDVQFVYMIDEKRITVIMVYEQGASRMVAIMIPPVE